MFKQSVFNQLSPQNKICLTTFRVQPLNPTYLHHLHYFTTYIFFPIKQKTHKMYLCLAISCSFIIHEQLFILPNLEMISKYLQANEKKTTFFLFF